MKKEYRIVFIEETKKYHIEYFENGKPAINVPDVEFYGYKLDEPLLDIRQGYTKREDSL